MRGRCFMFFTAISLLLLLAIASEAQSESPRCRVEECPNFRTIRYYEELGCVRSDGSSDCCPTHFDCSPLLSVDKTKCYYKGKTYEPGTETGSELDHCIPPCTCTSDTDGESDGEARFRCAGTDCGLIGFDAEKEPACYATTSLDSCCGTTGIRCLNDSESQHKTALCPYNGKKYREDELIDGTYSECKRCVCQKGFDGTLDGPWCKKNACEYLIFNSISKLGKCAPIFREGDNCCASQFHCPSTNDTVVRHSETSTENEGQQCSFGEHTLKIGDELQPSNNSCVTCKCEVPPFITCTKRADPECDIIHF